MARSVRKPRLAFDLPGVSALAIYLGLAVVFLMRGLGGRWAAAYIGKGVDPPQLMWLLAWWPHALARGLNPLFTDAIWAPHGSNLAWATSMPLVGVITAPLIALVGPVALYNLLCPLALALAAWSAFVLCRYLSAAYWPSLIGGYLFGFSSYMLGQSLAHLNLLLVFPIPLFALLLVRAFRSDIAWRPLVAGLAVLLIAQFLMFAEMFATMTLFAAAAFFAVFATGSRAAKTRVVSLLPTVALSYAIALAALTPLFYCMFVLGHERAVAHPPLLYSTDLINLIVPTSTMELGRLAALRAVSNHFLGYIFEAGGYVGVPLMLLVVAFAHGNWHHGWARGLIVFLIVAVVLAMGPFLVVAGRPVIPLPGLIVGALPLLGKALPARLMMYAFLALAIIGALWLAEAAVPRWIRIGAALAVIASMLPNLSPSFWVSPLDVPVFFRDALYRKYLSPGETAVLLPYGINGNSMLWQLQSHWYFRMAGGYAGNPPLEFRQWPIVRVFYRVGEAETPDAGDQLKAFLAAHRAAVVLLDDREAAAWRPLMATLSVEPLEAGGMTLYRVSDASLAPFRDATALSMETRLCRTRFAALLLAAENYLRSGHPPGALTPAEMQKLGLMPPTWIAVTARREPSWDEGGLNLPRRRHDPRELDGLWLGVNGRNQIEVGVSGWYRALRAVLSQYRADATDFAPRDLGAPARPGDDARRGRLVMSFTAEGLARAAARARGESAPAPVAMKAGVAR